MALPVISDADLEKFSLVLNGAPLTITGEQTGTASAANPSGLRLAGGNLFRDYSPWTEQEINDWSQGLGHKMIGENGFLWSELNTKEGNAIMLPPANTHQSLGTEDTPDSTTSNWNGYKFWESKIIEASTGVLYSFFGFQIYRYSEGPGTWASIFDVRTTIFAANHQAQRQSYIIDMCEFNGYLIIVTVPFFRTSATWTPPGGFTHAVGSTTAVGDYALYTLTLAGDSYGRAIPNVFAIPLVGAATPLIVGGQTTALPLSYTDNINATHINVGPVIDMATGNYESDGVYPLSGVCATACHAFSGYLFIGGSAGYIYTNGVIDSPWGASQPDTPAFWKFEGDNFDVPRTITNSQYMSFRLNSHLNLSVRTGERRWVTGFAGIKGQTIGEFYVYMATPEGLYMCDMAVPTLVKVLDYPEDPGNGRGIISHNNDIYIPTYVSDLNAFPMGGDIIRFTQSGQTVRVGLDQTPFNPSVGRTAATSAAKTPIHSTLQLATTPEILVAGAYGDDGNLAGSISVFPKILGLKGQGWHSLQARHTESGVSLPVVRGIYYSARTTYIHYNEISSKNSTPAEMSFGRFKHTDTNKAPQTFAADGYIFLGWFDAGSPLLQKDWQSISVYGDCLEEAAHTTTIIFEVSDTLPDCGYVIPVPSLIESYLHKTNAVDGEYVIPTTHDGCPIVRSGKYIGIAIRLQTSDTATTPVIRGIKLKYFVPIGDYFRFSYSVTLPKLCLNDLCGNPLAVYDQQLWDQALREAACSTEPIPFRDLDGKWYLVRVESESRRIEKVDYVGPPDYRTFDIVWNLVFIQVYNPTICDDGWNPLCL